jgi:hypothetical protein
MTSVGFASTLIASTVGVVLLACGLPVNTPVLAEEGIPPALVADYLHAVIESDRTVYTVHVVERLQKRNKMTAAEDWRVSNKLPLPAQFLSESANLAALTGSRVQYRLIALHPINTQNAPHSAFEEKGLVEVEKDPERAYTGTVQMGEERYFQAIYADRAVSEACVACHNTHPRSPKKDFKLHDTMGALPLKP